MRTVKILESIDRRILGAIQFVDAASEAVITDSLRLESVKSVSFVRNLSNIYVITAADGFEDFIRTFKPAPEYDVAKTREFNIEVADPSGRYLPRELSVRLPRNPEEPGKNADGRYQYKGDSVFLPQEVKLYRSPTAACCTAWATVRVTVVRGAKGEEPVRGAILTIKGKTGDFKDQVLAEGISDGRGEALLMAPKVPTLTFEEPAVGGDDQPDAAESKVIAVEIDALLEVKGVPDGAKGSVWPMDPDNLGWRAQDIETGSVSVKLKAGLVRTIEVRIVKP